MKIINIGILAHVDAGKTTLTESLLYTSGAIIEPGSVDKGTTRTDSMALERQRGITIQAAVTSFHWKEYKVNLVDTPGHMDFLTEVYRSLSVLDGAILVVSAKDGVQAQTRVLFHALRKMKIPTIIFINKIDQEGFVPAPPAWAIGTALGIIAGNLLPLRAVSALSVALYGMFLAIIIPPARKSRVVAALVAISFALSFLCNYLPGISALSEGTRTILLTVLISGTAAVLFPVNPDEQEAEHDA